MYYLLEFSLDRNLKPPISKNMNEDENKSTKGQK